MQYKSQFSAQSSYLFIIHNSSNVKYPISTPEHWTPGHHLLAGDHPRTTPTPRPLDTQHRSAILILLMTVWWHAVHSTLYFSKRVLEYIINIDSALTISLATLPHSVILILLMSVRWLWHAQCSWIHPFFYIVSESRLEPDALQLQCNIRSSLIIPNILFWLLVDII